MPTDEDGRTQVTVRALKNGPLMVRGACRLVDSAGRAIERDGGGTVLLCRCGNSSMKPFCDGSHKEVGFRD
jgi:CDGSH-type Zn-finger protein